jgi:hypothetical protein
VTKRSRTWFQQSMNSTFLAPNSTGQGFFERDVCEYLHQHRDNIFVQKVLNHRNYNLIFGGLTEGNPEESSDSLPDTRTLEALRYD